LLLLRRRFRSWQREGEWPGIGVQNLPLHQILVDMHFAVELAVRILDEVHG